MAENGFGRMDGGIEPMSEYEITESGWEFPVAALIGLGAAAAAIESKAAVSRRGALGAMFGAAVAGGAASAEAGSYGEEAKKAIDKWYQDNKEKIWLKAVEMQKSKDKTGKTAEPFEQKIPLKGRNAEIFSEASMEISYDGDVKGEPTYKVRYFVTSKDGKKENCPDQTLTLHKKK